MPNSIYPEMVSEQRYEEDDEEKKKKQSIGTLKRGQLCKTIL